MFTQKANLYYFILWRDGVVMSIRQYRCTASRPSLIPAKPRSIWLDAMTILHLRHRLERYGLTKVLFDEVGDALRARLLMRLGTIVDAMIIAAPPSTKNKKKARDPEMHQTKKGNH